jgi:hypothetical protein
MRKGHILSRGTKDSLLLVANFDPRTALAREHRHRRLLAYRYALAHIWPLDRA